MGGIGIGVNRAVAGSATAANAPPLQLLLEEAAKRLALAITLALELNRITSGTSQPVPTAPAAERTDTLLARMGEILQGLAMLESELNRLGGSLGVLTPPPRLG